MPFATRERIWEELPPLDGEPEIKVEKKEIREEKSGVETVKIVEVRTETVRKLKCVEERKGWKLFGLSPEDIAANDGMSESEDCTWEDPIIDKRAEKKQEFEEVKCRYCGGSHFSHACPRKIVESETSVEEPARADKPASAGASGKYSARDVAGRAGRSTDRQQQQQDIRVRVANLAENATKRDVEDLFARFNFSFISMRTNYDGTNNGFATVFFKKEEDARKACEKLNGHRYDHLILSVEILK